MWNVRRNLIRMLKLTTSQSLLLHSTEPKKFNINWSYNSSLINKRDSYNSMIWRNHLLVSSNLWDQHLNSTIIIMKMTEFIIKKIIQWYLVEHIIRYQSLTLIITNKKVLMVIAGYIILMMLEHRMIKL